jgi:hypothetical protein
MTNKIFMKIESPQAIMARQNAAYNYFLLQQQQEKQKQGPSMNMNPRKDLSSSMINRVHLAKPGCGSCGK